jgi:hypothetical protein
MTYEDRIKLIKAKATLDHAFKLSQKAKAGEMSQQEWRDWMEVNVKPVIMGLPTDIVMAALDRLDAKKRETN